MAITKNQKIGIGLLAALLLFIAWKKNMFSAKKTDVKKEGETIPEVTDDTIEETSMGEESYGGGSSGGGGSMGNANIPYVEPVIQNNVNTQQNTGLTPQLTPVTMGNYSLRSNTTPAPSPSPTGGLTVNTTTVPTGGLNTNTPPPVTPVRTVTPRITTTIATFKPATIGTGGGGRTTTGGRNRQAPSRKVITKDTNKALAFNGDMEQNDLN